MKRFQLSVVISALLLTVVISACSPAQASIISVGFQPLSGNQAGHWLLASTPTPNSDLPGEPVYLAAQVSPECDTGAVYRPGRLLAIRNGCDQWSGNMIERPFNASGEMYMPELDIAEARMGADENWLFWRVDMYPDVNEEPQSVRIVIELDTDQDGRGDAAIEILPALITASKWQTTGIGLLLDENNDVGGLKPIIPDNTNLKGNGYEAPGTAELFVRQANMGMSFEVALSVDYFSTEKINLGWWVWAVPVSTELTSFDLVDSLTADELYSADNTCMMIYGEKPKSEFINQCFKTVQAGNKKSGGCVQGAKPSSDTCWIWIPQDCKWQCFN